MRYQPARYSWYNITKNKPYYREDKELLNIQRMAGDNCINVESEHTLSIKELRKEIPINLINKINKGL